MQKFHVAFLYLFKYFIFNIHNKRIYIKSKIDSGINLIFLNYEMKVAVSQNLKNLLYLITFSSKAKTGKRDKLSTKISVLNSFNN